MIYSVLHLNSGFVRHHTLAFAPSSGGVYAFGCNSHGQLGTGELSTDKSPCPLKISFLSGKIHGTGKQKIVPFRSNSNHFSLKMFMFIVQPVAFVDKYGRYSFCILRTVQSLETINNFMILVSYLWSSERTTLPAGPLFHKT